MQSEQRRHDYLKAMGVTSWLPRDTLPGAKPSPDWVHTFLYGDYSGEEGGDDYTHDEPHPHAHTPQEIDKAHDVTHQLSDSLQAKAEPKPSSDARKNLRAGVDALAAGKPSSSKDVAVESRADDVAKNVQIKPREPSAKAPLFRLGFWVFDGILVVDSMPPQGRSGLNVDRYKMLCSNMIRAMGAEPTLLAAPYVLPWPMLVGDTLNQGPAVASEAVRYKVDKLFAQYAPRNVILLGQSAAQMVMQRDESIDEIRGTVFNYRSDVKAIVSHSLTQMLQIPDCKKEVWRDLQKILPLTAKTGTP